MIYAGIGSRETPQDALELFDTIGREMGYRDHILRSGYAGGADMAFFSGAANADGPMEMYIPWAGFNEAPRNDPRFIVPDFKRRDLSDLAARHHPAWSKCSFGAQKLHARNGCQILGLDLNIPADLVICWTVDGKGGGGTGQALRIAKEHGIPIFDFGDPSTTTEELIGFIQEFEQR